MTPIPAYLPISADIYSTCQYPLANHSPMGSTCNTKGYVEKSICYLLIPVIFFRIFQKKIADFEVRIFLIRPRVSKKLIKASLEASLLIASLIIILIFIKLLNLMKIGRKAYKYLKSILLL